MAMNDNLMKPNNPSLLHDDEDLLRSFFEVHQAATLLEDNGFSRRVMTHLPHRIPLWARLWSPCCILLSIVLFVHLRGFELIWQALREIFTTQAQQLVPHQFDPKVWLVAGGVLLFLVYRKLSQMA